MHSLECLFYIIHEHIGVSPQIAVLIYSRLAFSCLTLSYIEDMKEQMYHFQRVCSVLLLCNLKFF